jgi:predicted O-methyltransferase YrrM
MKHMNLTEPLYDYILSHCPPCSPVLAELAKVTLDTPLPQMQISPDQGSLLNMFAKLIDAKKIIEIGCFTGYSAICMASALRDGGKLVTLDIDPETTAVARKYFKKAGLDDKIDLRLAPALDSLEDLEKEWGAQTADMVFIDADKENMLDYFEASLRLLRPGGLIIGDNVLWGGSVIQDEVQDSSTIAIRKFNKYVKDDERVDRVMVNLADGLFICRKR